MHTFFIGGTILFGYIVGRIGHVYLNVWLDNPKYILHHWIYGLLLIVIGAWYLYMYVALFGYGLFISDLKDFCKFRFITPDSHDVKKFWHID